MNFDSLHPHCFFYYFLKHKALKVMSSHRPIGYICSVVQVIRLGFRPNSTPICIICPQEYFRVLSERIHLILFRGPISGYLLCFQVYSR